MPLQNRVDPFGEIHAVSERGMFTGNRGVIHDPETKTLLKHDTNWLNHLQFSPTDPNLLMYCHEGHWQLVDRIWTIDGLPLTRPESIGTQQVVTPLLPMRCRCAQCLLTRAA